MAAFSFNHIALSVKDVKQSIAFYQRVFDFTEIENTASNSKTRWLSLGNGHQLHLIPRPNAEIIVTKEVHFAIATRDFDQVVRHLESLDITYSDWVGEMNQVYKRKDGIRQLYFQDLDGYWVEINDDV